MMYCLLKQKLRVGRAGREGGTEGGSGGCGSCDIFVFLLMWRVVGASLFVVLASVVNA